MGHFIMGLLEADDPVALSLDLEQLRADLKAQRDGDSLVELREDRRRAILTELIAGQDWSAHNVAGARWRFTRPLTKARAKYTAKHQNERWAAEMADWSVEQFLAKAKMTTHGQLNRFMPKCADMRIGGAPCQKYWNVRERNVLWPQFVLATLPHTQPQRQALSDTELLAVELPATTLRWSKNRLAPVL